MQPISMEAEFMMSYSLANTRLVKKIEYQLSIHGLSFTEYMIMHQLDNAPNKTMRRIELAESVAISASGVTRLIAPMEKTGLVEKEANPRDARVSLVKLSASGERLYQEASMSFEHTVKHLTRQLSTYQLEKLIEFTGKLM